MEGLVREMQDVETGVPVRSQKLFLTSIPSAFMGYDLIEWLMERLNIEESAEAVHIANQLCQYGYFFPVSDSKNLIVKDDSSLYRFQTPYYWPWKHRMPDNVEYAIYLAKRTLRNKQRHGLEDYELESLNSLKKNLQNKWDFITMQAEEQVRLAKERKKGDKIVSDSQERAYWRVYRPPPGYLNHLEPAPVPNWTRGAGTRAKRRTSEDVKREVDFLRSSLIRTRVKVSQALDNLMQHCSTYNEYDSFTSGAQPSNPWVTEDPTFWHLNNPLVENPTEKRVKRWAITMEELVHDPTGLQEFTNYLRKEYSHENIRFWMAVNDLRRSAQSQIQRKVKEIFDEFLAPGAPCEINIDGKTMEKVHQELRNPTRFTFDSAAEHVYTLLLKKDCYPRFIRSEQYKNLLASGVQPLQKKRFFGFGGPAKKKSSTCNPPNLAGLQSLQQQQCTSASTMGRRRGSDRSLSGSVHELAVSGVREVVTRVSHSHSQSNLSDIPYRDPQPCGSLPAAEEGTSEKAAGSADNSKDVCPWDNAVDNSAASSSQETPVQETEPEIPQVKRKKSCIANVAGASSIEVDHHTTRKNSSQLDSGSSSSELSLAVAEVSERLSRTCALSPPSTVPPPPEKATHATSEERVIARIQTVRKYSTTDTRRPSITAKVPSASPDDLAAEDHSLRMYRKSCSTAVRKKSSAAAAPVINIDEPQEQSQQNQESSSDVACAWEEPQAPKVNEICPWEDEESCKVDTPFVKKYATLGYL